MRSSKMLILEKTEHLYQTYLAAIEACMGDKGAASPSRAVIRAMWDNYAMRVSNSYISVKAFGTMMLAELITEGGPNFDLEGFSSMVRALNAGNTPERPRFTLAHKLISHLPHLAAECATSTIYIHNGLFEKLEKDLKERSGCISPESAELAMVTTNTYMGYLREHDYMLRVSPRKWPFFRRDWIL